MTEGPCDPSRALITPAINDARATYDRSRLWRQFMPGIKAILIEVRLDPI